jgi:hypothetical protein
MVVEWTALFALFFCQSIMGSNQRLSLLRPKPVDYLFLIFGRLIPKAIAQSPVIQWLTVHLIKLDQSWSVCGDAREEWEKFDMQSTKGANPGNRIRSRSRSS